MADTHDPVKANLYSAFKSAASSYGDQVAFKADGGRGRRYTYAEVDRLAAGLARGLRDSRFADCSQVGLFSENRPEWPISYLAILAADKTVVPIDINLKTNEISYIIDHAGLKLAFVSGKLESRLRGLSSELRLLSFAEDSPDCWRQLIREEGDDEIKQAETAAVLIYTSGTTGAPKAVELTHYNLLHNIEGIREVLPFDPTDVFLSVLPLHHTLEATCGFLVPMMSGSTVVYSRSLKSKDLLEDIASNGVTCMAGVPLLYEKLYNSLRRGIRSAPLFPRFLFRILMGVSAAAWCFRMRAGRYLFADLRNQAGLGTIRKLVSGGAPLPAEIARFFNHLGLDFMQGYGLTECSPVVSVNLPGNIKFGSVGPPLRNIEVRIDRSGADSVGEIIVRGGNVMSGYRNNLEATAEVLKDGWFHTGDLGYLKGGHLWIAGRKKNIIVSAAGKNIYPEELEERLVGSLYVTECVVFGRKKENKQGEEVCAIVIPDLEQFRVEFGMDAGDPDMEKLRTVIGEVVSEVNNQVADYKRIRSFEVQLEELEKTSSKKVKRFLYK
jgi:long-chain acyl-CoA synthetase